MPRYTRLRLRPAREEGYTRFLLSGFLPEMLPRAAMHQLLSILAYWSEEPIDVVLFAADPGGFLDEWVDVLGEVPERHLRVHFRVCEDRFSE
jgi:hypothetical protein